MYEMQVLDVGSGSGYLTAIMAWLVCRPSPQPDPNAAPGPNPTATPEPDLRSAPESDPSDTFDPTPVSAREGDPGAGGDRDSGCLGANGGGSGGRAVGVEHIDELVKLATSAAEALPFARRLLRDGTLVYTLVSSQSLPSLMFCLTHICIVCSVSPSPPPIIPPSSPFKLTMATSNRIF